ncbi:MULTISPECIES: hypothetical protein [Romboutsia]|uniref:Uncharacterized protein n=1 Tax=Romboutsia hominis TaxID=1507512 RepID=A0A2P2BS37_9FIRM|nr:MULTISPECIES: hypothetical protein [Romboutsia]MCH1960460.1 hypothetical protein [Romboutsia hominis]MCH1969107.1 hypothetical protein [Romboutsia hominis]MDB8793399.1 hypothetical protein [Romboutsia sp. 1001216sp1]MDB8796826.1 hypothetical protein [Romboutsia sp. 1001216sp1]MDB8799687.1 hypothetical protein [Romboutsia sp. 1001216sp1]
MKKVDITNKAIMLLTALSVIYAILEGNILFLSPIVTIAIPYRLARYKEDYNYGKNKNKLTTLFLFNIASFILVAIISDSMTQELLDNVINIFVAFMYFKIMFILERKSEQNNNPRAVYEKLQKTVYVLEAMSTKMEDEIRNAKSEKTKKNIQLKKEKIEIQLVAYKSQLEILKMKIDSEKNN